MSFLDYTGKYSESGNKFIFKMKGGEKKRTKFSTFISNPTYDNTFIKMFCSKKSILKSLLNSVLFPESKLIEKLEYSKLYFPGKEAINRRYGFSSKSLYVDCRCFLKKNNNLNIKNNILMIDMEMQIGFNMESSSIDYENVIKEQSNFSDTWVVSFILKESINSNNNTIELNKIKNKINSEWVVRVKKYQTIKIIEINLNYCNSLIEENKDIEIIEELRKEGKEWIKLLSCPLWCQEYNFCEDIFIIPKYTQKGFISCNFVKKAIEEIIFRPPQAFDLSGVDEHYNKEKRKKFFLLEKEHKELKERLKKYEEEEDEENEEDEEDCSDIDDENNEDEEEEEEDEDSKNNNSKDEDAQGDMDIED